MYWFDGYSTPITHLVLGAYFPSILLFDFYSVCQKACFEANPMVTFLFKMVHSFRSYGLDGFG